MSKLTINYSDKFKHLAKAAFPEWRQLHKKIEDCKPVNKEIDKIATNLSPHRILQYFAEGNLLDLRRDAKQKIIVTELSGLWHEEKEQTEKDINKL